MTEDERQKLKTEMVLRFMKIFQVDHMCKMFAEMSNDALKGEIIYINSATGLVCSLQKTK